MSKSQQVQPAVPVFDDEDTGEQARQGYLSLRHDQRVALMMVLDGMQRANQGQHDAGTGRHA